MGDDALLTRDSITVCSWVSNRTQAIESLEGNAPVPFTAPFGAHNEYGEVGVNVFGPHLACRLVSLSTSISVPFWKTH